MPVGVIEWRWCHRTGDSLELEVMPEMINCLIAGSLSCNTDTTDSVEGGKISGFSVIMP